MSSPLRWMALVALDQPMLPSFDEVADYLGDKFPTAPLLVAAGGTEQLATCSFGPYTAAATLIPTPIPWSQLEGPAATAWYWPTATESLRDHVAHLLVTLIDEGGTAVEKSTRLTELVTALADSAPSVGIFWGPSRLVHEPQAFGEQALQMSADDLPLFLWIDFRVEEHPAGGVRLFTTGLDALGQQELEVAHFPGNPQTLVEHTYNLAHYMIGQQKVIRDGETIGLTDEVQATAHHVPSMIDDSMEVIRLEFEVVSDG